MCIHMCPYARFQSAMFDKAIVSCDEYLHTAKVHLQKSNLVPMGLETSFYTILDLVIAQAQLQYKNVDSIRLHDDGPDKLARGRGRGRVLSLLLLCASKVRRDAGAPAVGRGVDPG